MATNYLLIPPKTRENAFNEFSYLSKFPRADATLSTEWKRYLVCTLERDDWQLSITNRDISVTDNFICHPPLFNFIEETTTSTLEKHFLQLQIKESHWILNINQFTWLLKQSKFSNAFVCKEKAFFFPNIMQPFLIALGSCVRKHTKLILDTLTLFSP